MLAHLFLAAVCASAPSNKFAVLDVEGILGIEQGVAELLTETLTSEVARAAGPHSQVLGRREVQSMIGFERQRELVGCRDGACLADLAGALGVDYLIRASLGRLGNSYVLNLQRINVRKSSVERRSSRRVEGKPELLLDALPAAVDDLFAGTASAATANLPAEQAPSAVESRASEAQSPRAELAAVARTAPVVTGPSGADQNRVEVRKPRWPWWLVAGGLALAAGGGGLYFANGANATEFDRQRSCYRGDAGACRGSETPGSASLQESADALGASVRARDSLAFGGIGAGAAGLLAGSALLLVLPARPVTVAVVPMSGGAAVALSGVLPSFGTLRLDPR